MNKTIRLTIYSAIILIISGACGPSAAEKEAKRIADSTAAANVPKDSLGNPLPTSNVQAQEQRIRQQIDNVWATIFIGNGGKLEYTSMFASFKTEAKADGTLESNLSDNMNLTFYMFSNGACVQDSNVVRYPVIATSYKDTNSHSLSEAEIGELIRFLIPRDVTLYTKNSDSKIDCDGCTTDEILSNINKLISDISILCTRNSILERNSPEDGLLRFRFGKSGTMTYTYDLDGSVGHLYIEHCLWMGINPNVKIAVIGDKSSKKYRNLNIKEQETALQKLYVFFNSKVSKGKES